MTDDNTPHPEDETAKTTEPGETAETGEPATATADDVPPALPPADDVTPPPATIHAEPQAMEAVAADLPREEAAPEPETEPTPEPEPEPAPVAAEAAETSEATEEAEAAEEVEEAETPARPKRARKAKSGADGPADAPASTDPNAPRPAESPAGDGKKKWYVVKIQSGREDSIKAAIERKVRIEGLEEYFGQIAIPVEEIIVKKSVKVKDKKTGDKVTQEKKVVKHQKKYPGYLFAEVEFNDRILYLFRETSGVGDFVGAGLKREPTPMTDREVQQMLTGIVDKDVKGPKGPVKVKLDYEKGDKVKIRDGAFANMEGEVKSITDTKETGETPKVTVVVTVFGRPVDVTVDYWHVDKV